MLAQTPAWEPAAGGAMSFEVASIHLSPEKFTPPSFLLSIRVIRSTKREADFSRTFPWMSFFNLPTRFR